MTIDENTGRIEWTPFLFGGTTSVAVSVTVSDGRGGSFTQSFQLSVVDDPYEGNRAPQITSTPPGPAVEDHAYQYQVVAHDLDGDRLTYAFDYSLRFPPSEWTSTPRRVCSPDPEVGQAGTHQFKIRVDDALRHGLPRDHLAGVTAAEANNRPPQITSTPPGPAVTSVPRYQVVASDPDGDPLTYSQRATPMRRSAPAVSFRGSRCPASKGCASLRLPPPTPGGPAARRRST
jgi:hypothetical protein